MLKKITPFLAFTGLCLLAFFALKPTPKTIDAPINLPWDIETHSDGTSTVFGVRLEQTTLGEALHLLGIDHDLAVIANQENQVALEVYYSHFSTGPLKAKLVLVIDALHEDLAHIQENAATSKYMASGARQFSLNQEDLQRAKQWTVKSMSLTPSANLSEEIVRQRFGPPDEIINESEMSRHFLYNQLGLDVVINSEAKELLLYVAPRSFEQLRSPLENPSAT